MYDEAEWWVYLLVSNRKGPVTFFDDGTERGVEFDLRRHVFRVVPVPPTV